MATNFPTSLDNLSNPAGSDPVNNPSHASQHANLNDAVEKLEEKVGVNNSAVTTSLDYRVRQLELNPVTSTANKIEQVVVNNTGSTLLEGQVVYASGSVGASGKLRVSLSSNAAESTSTKTFGILAEDIINGGEGLVVTEGIVEGINTVGANDGDPVWLGVNGNKIFGLVNKPSAPAHLVFLGIVVRGGQANTGSIFVKIQNGFELEELHNVQITSPATGEVLVYDATTSLWKNSNTIASKTYVDTAVAALGNTSATLYVPVSEVGQADGIATLDENARIPLSQLGNLVDGAPTALDTLNELAAALGNNPNYATDITTALGTKVSKNGGDVITSSLPGVISLTVKGAASQTANLQEWQNSSGTVRAKVDASGNINAVGLSLTSTVSGTMFSVDPTYGGITSRGGAVGFSGSASLNIGTSYNAQSAIVASGFSGQSVPTVIIKAVASQTSNLQEWQNSSGTVLASIASTGQINAGAGFYTDWAGVGTGRIGAAHLSVSSQYLGNIVSIFKGVSGQTANLTEWQNSSGAILASVSAGGDLTIPSARVAIGITAPISLVMLGTVAAGATFVPIVAKGAASQTANLQQWQNSAGTVLAKVDKDGLLSNLYGAQLSTTNVAGVAGVSLSVGGQSGALANTVLKNSVSATYDFLQFQNSAGTVLAKVRSDGQFYAYGSQYGGSQYGSIGALGLAVGGQSGETSIHYAAGNLTVRSSTAGESSSGSAWTNNTSALIGTGYAGGIGLIIKSVASQTADLTEWQNSSGTVLAKVDSTGAVFTPTAAPGTNTTQVATTAFVKTAIDSSVQPGALYQTSAPTSPAVGQIWIDSDENVTTFDSNIIRRKAITATAGQTVFTADLPFIDGFEQIFMNGLLLVKTTDYTTSNSNTVTLTSAAAASDIIEIVSVTGANSVNTYTQAEVDALLAANTSVAPLSISANTTLLAKKRYFVTSASALTLTLPASPALNDEIQIVDASGNASTYNITVARNGNKINGGTGNLIIDNNGGWYTLLYTGTTYGWKVG